MVGREVLLRVEKDPANRKWELTFGNSHLHEGGASGFWRPP